MRHALLAPFLLAVMHGICTAQEGTPQWLETRFHRVHLNNGNFLDGQLLLETKGQVVLEIKASGNFTVRRDLIKSVEFVQMRSLLPDPVLPAEPAAARMPAEAAVERDAVKAPAPAVAAAPFTPEVRRTVEEILTRYTHTRSEFRRPLASLLDRLDAPSKAYVCWIAEHGMPGIDRPALIEASGQLGCPESLPSLLAVLRGAPDSFDRAAAVRGLARHGSREAIAGVHEAVGDPSGQVWRVASDEIVRLSNKGEADVPAIVSILKKKSDRAVPAMVLGKIGGDQALEALRDLLRDGETRDKIIALQSLAPFRKAEDGVEAAYLLSSNDEGLRKETCIFLGRIKHGPSVRLLINSLKDEAPGVAEAAHWSLHQVTELGYGADPSRWELWWERAGQTKFPVPQE